MKKLMVLLLLLTGLVFGVVGLSSVANAQTPGSTPVSSGATTGGNEGGKQACDALTELGVTCDPTTNPEDLAGKTIKNLLKIFSIVVGGVCVIMIIFGGFKFVTSGGDSDATKSARSTIIYAAVGLAVVVLAQSLVYFVFRNANDLQKASSSTTTNTSP